MSHREPLCTRSKDGTVGILARAPQVRLLPQNVPKAVVKEGEAEEAKLAVSRQRVSAIGSDRAGYLAENAKQCLKRCHSYAYWLRC